MNDEALDHKRLLANLSDEERISLTTKSDAQGIWMLVSHSVGLLITGIWIANGLMGWQIAMLFHGIQIIFLFTLLHETVHDTPFESIYLNRVVGWGCALLILLPPTWFRYFHLAHHRHTHDPEKDPELQGAPIESLGRYLWAITGLPVWWYHIRTMFVNAFGSYDYDYLPKSAYARVRREARIMLAIYSALIISCLMFTETGIFYLWIIPAILGQPFLRLYLMAEHGRCPHVANMLLNTRTTYTTQLVRWLAWNMPYHAEHHAYPAVPFHKLPKFHKLTKEHLLETENGYTQFHFKEIKHLS